MLRNRHSTLKRDWSATRLVNYLLNARKGAGKGGADNDDPGCLALTPRSNSRAQNDRRGMFGGSRPVILRYRRLVLAIFFLVISIVYIVKGVRHIKRELKCNKPRPTDDAEGYKTPMYPKPEFFQWPFENIKRDLEQCAWELGVPQVALLFLVKGDMQHEKTWGRWFDSAHGMLPEDIVYNRMCSSSSSSSSENSATTNSTPIATEESEYTSSLEKRLIEALPHPCLRKAARSPILGQHLFDVWVHPLKNYTGYPKGNTFWTREIPEIHRAETVWGTHTIIDATRALLAAALTNPLNKKFVLLSESDVPLYSPLTLYRQMIGEERSRLNACNKTGWETEKWSRYRQDMNDSGLHEDHWRKSWQWMALTREHAELVVHDTKIDTIFRKTCRDKWDTDWCHHKVCYSDEHYVPILLATLGKDNETDCTGELTDRDWSRVPVGTPHPYEYPADEVNATLFHLLRHPERNNCDLPSAATATAHASFINLFDKSEDVLEKRLQCTSKKERKLPPKYAAVGPLCPLLARKFMPDAADKVFETLSSCENGFRILRNDSCRDGEESMVVDPEQIRRDIKKREEDAYREWQRQNSWWRRKGWKVLLGIVLVIGVVIGFVVNEEGRIIEYHHKSIKVFSLLD